MQNFDYGCFEIKDKPSKIDEAHIKKKRLRQSAAQIWLLAVSLPVMIGKFIPENDGHWLCFTTLLELCRLIFKSSISELEILNLTFLIDEYLCSFREYFSRRIIPKMHFLVHYPRLIRLLGPLGPFWCMRFEAKHSYFKQLSRIIGNYINLPLTLAQRHQQWQCKNLFDSGCNFLNDEIKVPSKKCPVCLESFVYVGQLAEFFNVNNLRDVIICQYSWIKVGSNLYKAKKSVLICKLRGNVSFGFGLIKNILKINEKFIFVCEMYRTLKFDKHLQAYQVKRRNDKLHIALSYEELVDYKAYHLHVQPDLSLLHPIDVQSKYVILKTEIETIV